MAKVATALCLAVALGRHDVLVYTKLADSTRSALGVFISHRARFELCRKITESEI